MARHRHQFTETGKLVSEPDSRQRVTVITRWKCTVTGCAKTRTTKKKNRYFRKS